MNSSPKTALVTGGAGFIGSHLAERLVREGHRVRILDNLKTGSRENLDNLAALAPVDFIEGDLRDPQKVEEAVAGCDWVFHLAALVSVPESFSKLEECEEINSRGTLHLLRAASRQASRFLSASTCAVYGDARTLPIAETAPLDPLSPYAAAKLAAEWHCRHIAQTTPLQTLSLRFFNVYGPRQRADSPYSGVIAKFIDAAKRGQAPTIHGDGGQTRDFIHVTDVAACLLRCASSETPFTPGLALNVGTGEAVSLLTLWEAIEKAAGLSLPPLFAPPRQGDIRHSRADARKALDLFGWKAECPLAQGIATLL
ncbi:UDP-glucose 4-epimerase [Verrucomicrobium sp. GAS474]|uniref:SDR family NAD(P)-dependent oxidoreductase n=1 Tax=Verrucomicrobium sp. GAS474 TaxID=1882831 RepID=UPI00087A69D9|nr:SDR family NAD(P)-dependent oxidoreductase [Verrucomicrobium sp. GAS474]SDT98593.1 UDP-glucose 4-epimerase [Verrucomicrobium sp. GAS474]